MINEKNLVATFELPNSLLALVEKTSAPLYVQTKFRNVYIMQRRDYQAWLGPRKISRYVLLEKADPPIEIARASTKSGLMPVVKTLTALLWSES